MRRMPGESVEWWVVRLKPSKNGACDRYVLKTKESVRLTVSVDDQGIKITQGVVADVVCSSCCCCCLFEHVFNLYRWYVEYK